MTQRELTLHGYWRSSSSYRVRIALAWKGLSYEYVAVNLLAGDHRGATYRAIAATGFVPALSIDGHVIVESMAICELLEELVPTPALLPADPFRRAFARSFALTVASRIQPFQNLSTLQAHPAENRGAVARAAIEPGLAVLELLLDREVPEGEGSFCAGVAPSLADVFLVPQLYAARRFGVDLAPYPRLVRSDAAAAQLPAFRAAHPDLQPDAVV